MTSTSSLGAASGRGLPLQLLPAVGSGREVDGSRAPVAGRLTGLGLEVLEDPDAALDDLSRAGRRAGQRHEPGGVPGGTRGQALALEQDDVRPAAAGQVVGDAAPDDAAADHDDVGALGQCAVHGASLY